MTHFKVSNRFSTGKRTALIDIDETICFYNDIRRYDLSIPNYTNIAKVNRLYDEGYEVIYWTARGASSGIDSTEHTAAQLKEWGCKYHDLVTGTSSNPKPHFDLLVDDKSMRIEELFPETKLNQKVGFACSSFDLLHSGHAIMLKDCKTVCDYLIVGLQTDPTLDRPEKNKPVQSFEERKIMIESIKYVDKVVEYSTEDELLALIKEINPDIRILGTDWKGKPFTGHELDIPIHWHVRDHGYSTSNLRIRVAEAESLKNKSINAINERIF